MTANRTWFPACGLVRAVGSLLPPLLLANSSMVRAQHVMAQAIPLVTRATPTADGRSITEGYITQPTVMAEGRTASGHLAAHLMLDFEGLTLDRGELNTGGYGEGYVDRRHPHTYLHEAIVSAIGSANVAGGPLGASLSVGRGFAPFGSDDPMVRPFVKYPVNHHLAQVLERVVAIGALRWRGVGLEVGTFNGDEPTGPAKSPRWQRFGDSWSSRLTIFPVGGVELAASIARVKSPEEPTGEGLDQRKRSLVARWEHERQGAMPGMVMPGDPPMQRLYAMAEWAATEDWNRGDLAFRYGSLLAEAAIERTPGTLALRFERTDRPEEERLANPFRTPRPATDLSNLGITRWTTVTLHMAARGPAFSKLRVLPFVEVAAIHPEHAPVAGVFVPRAFYGSDRLWMLSAGARLAIGGMHHRMGRYGVAAEPPMRMDMTGPTPHTQAP